jgi:GDSL-like Lipase/Acylhydrolase family
MTRTIKSAAALAMIFLPTLASAQINAQESGYYVAMGDSVAAGEGAMPVTTGYAYQLYEEGAFGRTRKTEFANSAVRGARSWELRDQQVPQVLCAEPAQRPTVVTITAGANDFLRGDTDILGIAGRVAGAINLLLNNGSVVAGAAVLDPITGQPCRALTNVTVLVSNYYSIPHPDPAVFQQLDAALRGFDQALRYWLQFVHVPQGATVALVDLYTASLGRHGLVTGLRGGSVDFDIHPTSLGHRFIARQFETVWRELP